MHQVLVMTHEDEAIVYDNGLPGTYKVKGVLMECGYN
jgi:hypothetical protein